MFCSPLSRSVRFLYLQAVPQTFRKSADSYPFCELVQHSYELSLQGNWELVIFYSSTSLQRCFTYQAHAFTVGWCSGESAHLPPMWPRFDSRTQCHMWDEFVVGSCPCSERFFSGYSGFPLSSKTSTSKFQLDLERMNTFKRASELLSVW